MLSVKVRLWFPRKTCHIFSCFVSSEGNIDGCAACQLEIHCATHSCCWAVTRFVFSRRCHAFFRGIIFKNSRDWKLIEQELQVNVALDAVKWVNVSFLPGLGCNLFFPAEISDSCVMQWVLLILTLGTFCLFKQMFCALTSKRPGEDSSFHFTLHSNWYSLPRSLIVTVFSSKLSNMDLTCETSLLILT